MSVICDAEFLDSNLKCFLQWIESEVAKGRRFLPEQTVQLGWSMLKVQQRTDGTLSLVEPDFKSMPIRFVDSVTNTLLHVLLQKSVNESLGLPDQILTPSLRDSAIICTKFGSTPGFIMDRLVPKDRDSGWFFGCDSGSHDHTKAEALLRVSIYEAVVRHTDKIIPFLSLPPGVSVGFKHKLPIFKRGDLELPIRQGSYLERKYADKQG